jgi:hypothetical protein
MTIDTRSNAVHAQILTDIQADEIEQDAVPQSPHSATKGGCRMSVLQGCCGEATTNAAKRQQWHQETRTNCSSSLVGDTLMAVPSF